MPPKVPKRRETTDSGLHLSEGDSSGSDAEEAPRFPYLPPIRRRRTNSPVLEEGEELELAEGLDLDLTAATLDDLQRAVQEEEELARLEAEEQAERDRAAEEQRQIDAAHQAHVLPGGRPLAQIPVPVGQAAAPAAQAQPAAAMAQQANQATASQLNAVPDFTGEVSQDIELWLKAVDRAGVTFNWLPAVKASAAKQKLTGKAAFWLESQRRMNREYPQWEHDDEGIKNALLGRFKSRLTQIEATEAISRLQQKKGEPVREFYDRVIWAVDVKNHSFTAAQKAEAWYANIRDADIYTFFSAGLQPHILQKAMSGGNPPLNNADLLERADAIEKALAKATTGGYVHEVQVASVHAEGEEPAEFDPAKEIAALKLQLSQLECFNCRETGHFSRNCPKPRTGNRGGFQSGRGRGQSPWRGQGTSGNRGGFRGGRGGFGGRGRGSDGSKPKNRGWKQQVNSVGTEQDHTEPYRPSQEFEVHQSQGN